MKTLTGLTEKTSAAALLRRFPALPPAFFQSEVTKVARALLGKGLLSLQDGRPLLCEIVETEAYRGEGDDPASHCHRGMTPRNRSMFAVGGTCYVYLSYGINHCMNVVTGRAGEGSGILIRAGVPLLGLPEMAANRGLGSEISPKILKNLLSGPGKLTRALGVDRSNDGALFSAAGPLALLDLGIDYSRAQIAATPRIGISSATTHLWRFIVKDSPWLSRAPGRPRAVRQFTLS